MVEPRQNNRFRAPRLLLATLVALVASGLPGQTRAHTAAPARNKADDDDPAEESDPDAVPDGIPEHTRGAPHPDCGGRVPLFEHEVQDGEHLWAIAGRYGVRHVELIALNPSIRNPDKIRPGQMIRVCPTIAPRLRKEIHVSVQPGATAGAIALAHGLTVDELVGFQDGKLADPNHLRAGQVLRLVVDAGVVPDFLPALPPPQVARGQAGRGQHDSHRSYPSVSEVLPERDGYYIKRPNLAYGTAKTITGIQRAVERYRRRIGGGPMVHIGDISRKGGGQLKSHVSHRSGRDVDVGYVLRGADGHRTQFVGVTEENFDIRRTWSLLHAFVDTGDVEVIFMDYNLQRLVYEWALRQGTSKHELDALFQYPRGAGRSHGMVRHWPNHAHHFHVRFRR